MWRGCASASPFRRGTLPGAPVGDAQLATLSVREREILLEVARGRSNAEIAAALHIAEPTVKTNLTRLRAKLDLLRAVELVSGSTEARRPSAALEADAKRSARRFAKPAIFAELERDPAIEERVRSEIPDLVLVNRAFRERPKRG